MKLLKEAMWDDIIEEAYQSIRNRGIATYHVSERVYWPFDDVVNDVCQYIKNEMKILKEAMCADMIDHIIQDYQEWL